MRQFAILTGALCVIAAISLLRLHLIDSQYATVALSNATSTVPAAIVSLPIEPRPTATTSPASFPLGQPVAPKSPAGGSSLPVTTATPPASQPSNPAAGASADLASVNGAARDALVNIICTAPGSEGPVSGSGVIIDPRGIILTNAHVGQYVLLADSGRVSLSCTVRAGSPAQNKWHVHVLYLSQQWITAHAGDIREQDPLGTGENDYALLEITSTIDGSALPASFPYLPIDASETAQSTGQSVLLASYPAGFLGGISTMYDLDLTSTITTIKQLFTFSDAHTPDLLSLGGVIVAQSGSSGGAVVDAAGRLIAIIATSSTGDQTDERDLRAITLYHINQSMTEELGEGLSAYLSGDLAATAHSFRTTIEPALIDALLTALTDPNSGVATSTGA